MDAPEPDRRWSSGMPFSPGGSFPEQQFRLSGCLILVLLLFVGCLLSFFLIDAARTALMNLNLSPGGAMLVLFGIVIGSMINIPISRRLTGRTIEIPPRRSRVQWPPVFQQQRLNEELVIAVNVGGCVIPTLLGIWLLRPLLAEGGKVAMVLLIGMWLNSAICYLTSRPIKGLGILLPLWVPALVALLVPWIALSDPAYEAVRPATAYLIGISGPLLGADLARWKDFHKIGSGMVAIGGAGTWDGILLSGLVAAFFA